MKQPRPFRNPGLTRSERVKGLGGQRRDRPSARAGHAVGHAAGHTAGHAGGHAANDSPKDSIGHAAGDLARERVPVRPKSPQVKSLYRDRPTPSPSPVWLVRLMQLGLLTSGSALLAWGGLALRHLEALASVLPLGDRPAPSQIQIHRKGGLPFDTAPVERLANQAMLNFGPWFRRDRPDATTPTAIAPADRIAAAPYGPEAIDYFSQIAFGNEFNANADSLVVRKWTQDMRLAIVGTPSQADLQALYGIVMELNQLLDSVQIILTQEQPNAWIHFVPEREFGTVEPNYVPGNLGFFYVWWNAAYELRQARILISTTGISQEERSHLIREELTQSLGLMNDAWSYADSMFYQGWTSIQQYSALDRDLIRILYDPRIQPGMNEDEVRTVFGTPP